VPEASMVMAQDSNANANGDNNVYDYNKDVMNALASRANTPSNPSNASNTNVQVQDTSEGADSDISTSGMYRVFIHPSSVNFSNTNYGASNFILFGETSLATGAGVMAGKSYVRDVTEVSVFPLLFFGGKLEAQYLAGTLTVDGWMRFSASGKLVALLQALRREVDAILVQKIEQPEIDTSDNAVLRTVCNLLDSPGGLR